MKISNKKAISPVIATIILIAITLIAVIAMAGFVSGFFSSFAYYCNYNEAPPIVNSISLIIHGTYPNNTNWLIVNNKIYLGSIYSNGNYPNGTYWYDISPILDNGQLVNGVCEP
jgi:flagellin-like protein